VRAVAVAIVGALAATGLLLFAGGSSSAPAPMRPRAAAAAAAPPACVLPRAGTHRLPSIDGRVPVVLHVGRGAKVGGPLVLGLPGAGQTARDFAGYTGYSKMADRKGFTVAYPTATGARPFWNISGTQPGKPDDVAYLRAVIAAAVQASCADPARVTVTGVSNGGGMAARMACEAADLLAAAAPVAGGYKSLPDCHPSRPIPMLEIHGAIDHVVPYDGDEHGAGSVPAFLKQWRRLDGCHGAARRSKPRGNVVELRWSNCARGTAVEHDRITDADHSWPGEDDIEGLDGFASTRRTWSFLARYRRN
jgi:polyhydroxybutyrate depolymerase